MCPEWRNPGSVIVAGNGCVSARRGGAQPAIGVSGTARVVFPGPEGQGFYGMWDKEAITRWTMETC